MLSVWEKRERAMYLKRDGGPVSVPLPDGSIMTRSDLPPVNATR